MGPGRSGRGPGGGRGVPGSPALRGQMLRCRAPSHRAVCDADTQPGCAGGGGYRWEPCGDTPAARTPAFPRWPLAARALPAIARFPGIRFARPLTRLLRQPGGARVSGKGVWRTFVRWPGLRPEWPASPGLLAPGTTASAPGGAPAPGGHGPDHRTRALSLPDAPGASGGRHHLILVPGKTLPPPLPPRGSSNPAPLRPRGLTRSGPRFPRRPPLSLLFLCDLLPRTATSRPAFLSRSPARNMRNRTFSEHLGPGGQN